MKQQLVLQFCLKISKINKPLTKTLTGSNSNKIPKTVTIKTGWAVKRPTKFEEFNRCL